MTMDFEGFDISRLPVYPKELPEVIKWMVVDRGNRKARQRNYHVRKGNQKIRSICF
jgi:hypothetical protein